MLDSLLKQLKPQMDAAITRLRDELRTIHVGRADSLLVENIMVDQYGQKMPLKGLANIAVQPPATIIITPWDKGSLIQIEAAIRESGRNLSPVNDRNVIRITLPPLSEERRGELVKLVKEQAEQTKISLRTLREDAWREIQTKTQKGELREDDRERGKKSLDDLIHEMNGKVEALVAEKEQDVLTV